MSFAKELMVGYRSQGKKCKLCPTRFPLGFAKNVTGKKVDDKSFESIKKWCESTSDVWEPAIVKNEPTYGMKITGFVSRYSTSNKWFEVQDPRGFTLQISCDNLMSLVREFDIIKGVIQTECIWDTGGQASLVPVNGVYYKSVIERAKQKSTVVKVSARKLVVGHTYKEIKYGSLYTFLGRFSAKTTITRVKPRWHLGDSSDYGDFDYSLDNGFVFLTQSANGLNPNKLEFSFTKTCPKLQDSDRQSQVTMDRIHKSLKIMNFGRGNIPSGLRGKTSLGWDDKITLTDMVIPDINFLR
jgi:hypothetical protein